MAMALFETSVSHPLYRAVCLHHLAEMDGPTHYNDSTGKFVNRAWIEERLCKQESNVGQCEAGRYCF